MATPADTKKYEQSLINGAAQGGIVLGTMWALDEMGMVNKRKPAMSSVALGASVVLSNVTVEWLLKMKWWPKA